MDRMRIKKQIEIRGSLADDFLKSSSAKNPSTYSSTMRAHGRRLKGQSSHSACRTSCHHSPARRAKLADQEEKQTPSGIETSRGIERRSYGAGSGALSDWLSGAVARVDQPCPAQWRGCESRREGWRGIPMAGKNSLPLEPGSNHPMCGMQVTCA